MAEGEENKAKMMWQPDKSKVTQMDQLRNLINQRYGLNLETYHEFHKWSCENYSEFWEEVWKFTEVVHSKSYEKVIDKTIRISDIPEWFHGARMNYAENLLRYDDDKIAIYSTGEGQTGIKSKTFKELRHDVSVYAEAMKEMGVQSGDRVVGYIPNCMEAVIAMLATSSIGAIWSSTSPDFGVVGVLERFSQIRPKLIFSVNAVHYNGKVHNHLEKVEQVVRGLPDLQKVVILPFVQESNFDLCHIPNSCSLEQFLSDGMKEGRQPLLKFEQVPFNHPLYIMYSSGTTGVPKCMVHSVGGTLLKHLEEHRIQSDMTRDDIMFYYTTAGWMMWNWMVSVLAVGAAIFLYDGSPLVPSANIFWDLIDQSGITILGTGAKWLSVLEEKLVKPRETHSLKSLRMILSTGSPLKPQSYEYVYRDIKSDILLGSISGGTDIIACFMGQNVTLPVYKGEIQCMLLGCDMQSWDEMGKAVFNTSGELICLKPFPSMPVRFWNDVDNLKYHRAYFNKFEGIWAHGDFCLINSATGGLVMLGRSDGTLNPNGVRFGSAEIYHIVESFKEIADSVCVPQRKADGSEERVILFLKMAPGSEFNKEVVASLKSAVRTYLTSRHVPSMILPTKDIPYTISGKKVEIAVRQAIHGEEVLQKGAFSNPDAIDLYHNIPELQGWVN